MATPDIPVDPFSHYVLKGESELRSGDLVAAHASFLAALSECVNNDELSVVFQSLGITCRLDGNHTSAATYFLTALNNAKGNHQLTANIQNDLAMLYMEMGDRATFGPLRKNRFDRAERLLIEARDTFIVCAVPDKVAVSEGFLARLQLFKGRRKDAQYSFRDADVKLMAGNNRDHELDNLMWYIGVAEAKERPQLVRRARELITSTGQERRLTQLRLVQLGINPLTLLHARRFVKRIIRK